MSGDFQAVPPLLFTAVGELLGALWADQLPFNVQNAVGNWLQLVGQAILTYNAQQQLAADGPGQRWCEVEDSENEPPPEAVSANQLAQLTAKVAALECSLAEIKEILLKKR